jgi:hypothetical protein
MPQTPKTAPGYASVSINGGEYYFIKGLWDIKNSL